MRKIVIEVRANEYASRRGNPNVPWSSEELAADATACREEGAAIYHFHARKEDGAPDHAPENYGATLRRIHEATDLLVMPTLGAHEIEDPLDRVGHVLTLARDASTRADLAPVDLASTNIDPYVPGRGFLEEGLVYRNPVGGLRGQLAAFREAEVPVDAVLWNVGSCRLLGALLDEGDLSDPSPVEVVLSDRVLACHPATEAGLDAMLAFLPPGRSLPWLALCAGGDLLPLLPAIATRGGHLSLGLGDHPHEELGRPSNAELVRETVRRLRELGCEPATPEESRELLALP